MGPQARKVEPARPVQPALPAAAPLTTRSPFSAVVPKEQQLQAVQAAILLLADESREVLQTLLCFLQDVVSLVEENQMTPMNLAVCLAPSLFHLNLPKKASSPRWVFLGSSSHLNQVPKKKRKKCLMSCFNLSICQHLIYNQRIFQGDLMRVLRLTELSE